MQKITGPFEVKELTEAGEVEGYASVFGVKDLGGDTVMPGAFASAEGKSVPMLWQHDPGQPIGVFKEVREDERGLFVKGNLVMGTTKGRETYELLKADALKGISIGYRTKRFERDGNGRKLMELDLMEASAVTFPMLPEAQFTSVKNDMTVRDWEAFLRDEGRLSNREAKAFCAGGFKALAALRDEATEGNQAGEEIQALLRNLWR